MATHQSLGATRLLELVRLLDIPDSYYEKAVNRYRALANWFDRPESTIRALGPKIYPQGSFRLGTVIRPLLQSEEYDLDLVSQLCFLNKVSLSQRDLKHLVGGEVKSYAEAHGVKAPVDEGKRAWRLDYADEVSFHIDILASVPEDDSTINSIIASGVASELASSAIALTCTSDPNYDEIATRWPTSNPEGYGTWFEKRMAAIARLRREALLQKGLYASVQDVPTYRLKTPLQRSIQLLKRHRDVMFQYDQELKPISIVITTLSAQAYSGESDLYESLMGILNGMPRFVRHHSPRIPNPTNFGEDFANKWSQDSRLEKNFNAWLDQAKRDAEAVASEVNPGRLKRLCESGFSVTPRAQTFEELEGVPSARDSTGVVGTAASIRNPVRIASNSPSPWACAWSRD